MQRCEQKMVLSLLALASWALPWLVCKAQDPVATAVKQPTLTARTRYKLQAGDKLDISFRYTPEMNQSVAIEPDGYINLTAAGEIKVSEMTLEQATELIEQVAGTRLHAPVVTLTLKDFHRPYYVVAGEVKHPGRFEMEDGTTTWQAILLAGGLDSAARSSQVVVFHRLNSEDAQVRVLDLHHMLKGKDLEHDLMLQPGDMVLVPRDRIAKFDRIVKAANLGLYFNPSELGF
jgi:polysaccharide biosynthesis/export protein